MNRRVEPGMKYLLLIFMLAIMIPTAMSANNTTVARPAIIGIESPAIPTVTGFVPPTDEPLAPPLAPPTDEPLTPPSAPPTDGQSDADEPPIDLTNEQILGIKTSISSEITTSTENINKIAPPEEKPLAETTTTEFPIQGVSKPASKGFSYSRSLYQQVTGLEDYYYNYGGYINIFVTVKNWYKQYYPGLRNYDIAPIPYSRTYVYLKYWNPYQRRWFPFDNQYKLTETNGEANFGLRPIPYNFLNRYSTRWMMTVYSYSADDDEYTFYTKTFNTYNY